MLNEKANILNKQFSDLVKLEFSDWVYTGIWFELVTDYKYYENLV